MTKIEKSIPIKLGKKEVCMDKNKCLFYMELFLVIGILLVGWPLKAAYFQVSTVEDNVPGSLRMAVTTANTNGEDDTLYLPAGVYVLSGTPDEDGNTGGDLDIDTPGKISITGAGKDITFIDGNYIDRVMDILKGSVSITEVTIRKGRAPAGAKGNYPNVSHHGRHGGGILIHNTSTLELNGCIICSNFSGNGGSYAIPGPETPNDGTPAGNGGGICNKGTLILDDCIITFNTTGHGGWYSECVAPGACEYYNYPAGDGCGIYNEGILIAWKSSITSNPTDRVTMPRVASKGGNGGGLYNTGQGKASLYECTISGNLAGSGNYSENLQSNSIEAGQGGGIFNSGELTLTQCLINDNMSGSGDYYYGEGCLNGGDGSGIYNAGSLSLINSTISNNFTGWGGHSCEYPFIPDPGRGAIYNAKTTSLTNCTVCFNSNGGGIYNAEGTVTIKNTLTAGNHGDEQTVDLDAVGNLSSKGYNLIENTDGCTIIGDTTGNITGVDANLGALSDNGGATQTHALLPGSPTLDAGSSRGTKTDQRGYNRPMDLPGITNADDGSDIGAYESSTLLIISGRVTEGVNNLEGVTLYFSNNGGSTTTDKDGQYIHPVNTGWSGTVTPSKTDYHFTPPLRTYSNVKSSFTFQDYTAVPDPVWVKIENPKPGAVVSGIVEIQASAVSGTNNEPGRGVSFYIDNEGLQHVYAPYEVNWDSKKVPNGVHTIKATAENAANQSASDEISIIVDNKPSILLSRQNFYFGMDKKGNRTGPQRVLIRNSGAGVLNWTAAADRSWLDINPGSGKGNRSVELSINSTGTGLAGGTHTCKVTFTDPAAIDSPQEITVTLKVYQKSLIPFGEFSTPLDGSTVNSSIPVTGWVVDDMQVISVKIYRDAVHGEGSAPVYIGDAVFVEGARPDVEQAYPGYPFNYQAGWGYMMLTNFLPNGGNGTFTLRAIATDVEGHQVSLGTKTIICDNAHAVKPFGAIDTPIQGGSASGSAYFNWGWALTPLPNTIPKDGSTIRVWVDGVSLGSPVYNLYRKDIATLFPGYNNSSGAVAYYLLDTLHYEDGLHTIAWSVKDSAGNQDGIGSRYFNVMNTAQYSGTAMIDTLGTFGVEPGIDYLVEAPADFSSPVYIRKDYPVNRPFQRVFPGDCGDIVIEIKETQRLEIHLQEIAGPAEDKESTGWGNWRGYLASGNELKKLPVGTTFDMSRGIFYWQPGPGFIGEYRFVFFQRGQEGEINKRNVVIKILP
jgi:hypothetical protein